MSTKSERLVHISEITASIVAKTSLMHQDVQAVIIALIDEALQQLTDTPFRFRTQTSAGETCLVSLQIVPESSESSDALAEIAALAQPLGPADLARNFDSYTGRIVTDEFTK